MSATSTTAYQGSTQDAPPGEDFLVTTVTITSAVTDRPEPDPGFTDNGTGPFVIAIPNSERSLVASVASCDTSTTDPCLLSGESGMGPENPAPADPTNAQLAAGGTTQVAVFAGAMPSSVAASSATVYYTGGASPVQIPTG
jgi:hypothetical protein